MKKLHIHYLQHVSYEDPGCILSWIKGKGHQVSTTKFYQNDSLPDPDQIDWLIIMGGPMGINDENEYPWLESEKAFIKKAIGLNKTVIGICLGAQLIAAALGAKVYPNKFKEIGWFTISLSEQGKNSELFTGFEPTFEVFHWHGDTFDLPQNAIHLASSSVCENQAFLVNNKVLGLQFHFEVSPESLKNMAENGKDELLPEAYIQSAQQIINHTESILSNNQKMFHLLNALDNL